MLCAAGDWLQGPYVYALYQHYGFDRGDIGRLFIAGFGSSMVFGTVVGALADRTCACDTRGISRSPCVATPLLSRRTKPLLFILRVPASLVAVPFTL